MFPRRYQVEKDDVLRSAVTAGFDVIRENDLEPDLTTSSAQKMVEQGWPLLEGFKQGEEFPTFEELFKERFEGRELQPFGGSVFDFVVGNVRNAVLHEVIQRLEEDLASLEFCSTQTAFKSVPARDWQIAIARVKDDISTIRSMVA